MSRAQSAADLPVISFTGTEQRLPYCDLSSAQDSFNVEFIDGTIRRRLGREKLFVPTNIRPTVVAAYTLSGGTVDITSACTDGNLTTAALTNFWNDSSAILFIGSPFRYAGINFTLLNALSTTQSINVLLPSRALPNGFNYTLLTVSDGTGTPPGGPTMKQSGTVSWAFSDWGTSQWSTGVIELSATWNTAYAIANNTDLYWTYITLTGTGTGGDIAEISLTMVDKNSLNLWSESDGMTEYVTRNGRRMIVSTNCSPSQFNNTTVATYPENRVVYFDFARGDMVPIRVPNQYKSLSAPNRAVSYATFNGWLIGSNPEGQLWKYDGSNCSLLEAMPGQDVVNGVLGAAAYTGIPMGTMLEVYRNRLAVTGNALYPMQFQLSLEDNNLTVIPANATVGGPNVWPLRYVFSVPGKQGDRIMGASVINDRYCILTRNQLWVFDDQSLKLSNSDIGCAASGSVCRIDNMIYFLSDLGVCTWDSVNIQIISDPVWDTLYSRINWKALDWVTSVHDKNRAEYWLWLPINGETQNQIALIYNYRNKSWRMAGGWYPFDSDANRDAASSPAIWSATAACPAMGALGRNIVLSSDANGIVWQESIGYEDDGIPFPAYAVFRPIGSRGMGGETYSTFRNWYLEVDLDGATIQGIQLGDGERFDQEIDRQNNSVALNSLNAQKQALLQNAVSSMTGAATSTPLYSAPPSWSAGGVAEAFGQRKKLKLSFGRNLTWMQPAVHWRPISGNTGRGTIYSIQFEEAPKTSAR